MFLVWLKEQEGQVALKCSPEFCVPTSCVLVWLKEREGQVALKCSPEFCLKLTFRYL